MDLEAPMDAVYVWLGAGIVSVTLAGAALGLPGTPPPDANAAANAIDEVASSTYGGSATYEHDATLYWVDGHRIAMKNDGGVAKATVNYGVLTPVDGSPGLRQVLQGTDPRAVFASESSFNLTARVARNNVDSADPDWREADGKLYVRTVIWGDVRVTLVDA